MEKLHFIGVRFDNDLFYMLNNHDGKNSDIVRVAVKQYLVDGVKHVKRNVKQADVDEEISDEAYSTIYNDIYNQEVYPVSLENKYLKRAVHVLEDDKHFLRSQVNALMIGKMPLLSRLKMRLLDAGIIKTN